MKITKSQLRALIKEELDKIISEGMKERAILSVWEEYEKGTASLPDVRHPKGAKREERACSRRTNNRLADGKGKDCWWCAKENRLLEVAPEKDQC